MAQFLGIHDVNDLLVDTTKELAGDPWEAYKTVCAAHNCKPLHVHFNKSVGKAFCVTEANASTDVQAAHDDANLKLQDLIEVELSE
ncbi:MAG TPA: nickel-binding protein [Candidatus Saccharimonadales bacterium]|nr:nickel-binding protein [Candidatus Saccharimonadales bacterium]